jgi:hypothetical protein
MTMDWLQEIAETLLTHADEHAHEIGENEDMVYSKFVRFRGEPRYDAKGYTISYPFDAHDKDSGTYDLLLVLHPPTGEVWLSSGYSRIGRVHLLSNNAEALDDADTSVGRHRV